MLLFVSLSIKERRLLVDSPDIDFSLVELKNNSKKCSSLNPKTCSNPVVLDQFSFLLHRHYYLIFKSSFKINYFLGNQIDRDHERRNLGVSKLKQSG